MRVRSLCVMLAMLAACGRRGRAAPARIETGARLARAATCEPLTRQIQDTAARQMRAQMDESKRGYVYGLPAASSGAATPAAGAGPASYSTTNTQVTGVDEADFVKNDGTRIFVLAGRTLFAATSWPPQSLAVAGKLEIGGWAGSMFLEGDRVVVFSSIWTVPQGGGMGPPSGGAEHGPPPLPCPSQGCYWGWATNKI